MKVKNKTINSKALSEHTRRIFSIWQPLPASALGLLLEKNKRDLTEKQQKQIYDQIKQKNIFPVLTSPKSIMDFCSTLTVQPYKPGQDCFVIIDGAVKIFQQATRNHLSASIPINETLRLSLGSGVAGESQSHKIERQKLGISQVLVFDSLISNLSCIASSSVLLLRIPYETYSVISLSSYMVEVKKKQQFFTKIPLFQRHYRSSLEDFVASLEEVSCSFGKTIFREGEEVRNIFIIKEGEFILEKNVSTTDLTIRQGKLISSSHLQSSEDNLENDIKHVHRQYRACPYKLIGAKQILGDCEYLFNNKFYMYSMRCHKQGSKLYSISAQLFFKKLLVSENGIERVNSILARNFEAKKRQIEAGVKFNKSNTLILKFMPNSTIRHKTHHQDNSKEQNNWSTITQKTKTAHNSTQRSCSFFEKMNKTIINQHKGQIRKRNESRSMEHHNDLNTKKIYKTPAVVQEVVQIVNQKKAYHRLRNLGMEKKNAFEFDINNVPPFIKKKYGHILDRKKSQ